MHHVNIHDIIFIDIETVSCAADYTELSTDWQKLWAQKVHRILPEGITEDIFYGQRAGVMAEFSKVVCISMGYFMKEENLKMRVKSWYGHDEKDLLSKFLDTMQRIDKNSRNWHFAGHNIKEFDIPFICRRLIINGIVVPPFLDFQNMKPWETNIIDSFQYWRFGDYKNFTSLALLAAALGIASPKDDIDGSMVGDVYWKDRDLERIARYCEKDVVTVANIILKFKQLPLLHDADVEVVSVGN